MTLVKVMQTRGLDGSWGLGINPLIGPSEIAGEILNLGGGADMQSKKNKRTQGDIEDLE